MIIGTALEILNGVGKVLGAAKAVKSISNTIEENSARKRKERQLNEQITRIRNRSIFEALAMYLLAGAAGGFLSLRGVGWFILVAVMFLGHCANLSELYKYTDIKREIVLSAVVGVVCLVCFLMR